MNLAYQIEQHLHAHMQQWPWYDVKKVRKEIREALVTGNAWLWGEPYQFDLFKSGEVCGLSAREETAPSNAIPQVWHNKEDRL